MINCHDVAGRLIFADGSAGLRDERHRWLIEDGTGPDRNATRENAEDGRPARGVRARHTHCVDPVLPCAVVPMSACGGLAADRAPEAWRPRFHVTGGAQLDQRSQRPDPARRRLSPLLSGQSGCPVVGAPGVGPRHLDGSGDVDPTTRGAVTRAGGAGRGRMLVGLYADRAGAAGDLLHGGGRRGRRARGVGVPCLGLRRSAGLGARRRQPARARPSQQLCSGYHRDPFLWQDDDGWHMLLGGGTSGEGRHGQVLRYDSPDATAWTYKGVFYSAPRWIGTLDVGEHWECPQVLLDGDAAALVVSCQAPGENRPLLHSVAFTGALRGRAIRRGARRQARLRRRLLRRRALPRGIGTNAALGLGAGTTAPRPAGNAAPGWSALASARRPPRRWPAAHAPDPRVAEASPWGSRPGRSRRLDRASCAVRARGDVRGPRPWRVETDRPRRHRQGADRR